MEITLPQYVTTALQTLTDAGFEAYVVGGSVRDLYLNREPKDYDITTDATPEQIQAAFTDNLYNNSFGTVVVRIMDGEGIRHEIEVTPYRKEAEYTDQRHPDKVEFGTTLEEDLQRRDFTMNAMAYDGENLVDPFNGRADCDAKMIRTVGNPDERFSEDALRLLRACRFAAQLDFNIDEETLRSVEAHAGDIANVSWERIRDEILKVVSSDNSFRGFWIMRHTGLLKEIIPELEEGYGVEQNRHHIYTIFTHNLLSLQYCPSDDPLVRMAALLHDIGKTRTKQGEGPDSTFYNHEVESARMAEAIMKRLKFSKKDTERVTHLVRQHMFYYEAGEEMTDAAVRRLVKRIGRENLDDLMAIRIGERMGSGTQKEKPYKLVELERRIRMVEKDPMDTTMLKIDGHDIMELTGLQPGREVGVIMDKLLDDILEDPSLNTRDYLTSRAVDLFKELQPSNKETDKEKRR